MLPDVLFGEKRISKVSVAEYQHQHTVQSRQHKDDEVIECVECLERATDFLGDDAIMLTLHRRPVFLLPHQRRNRGLLLAIVPDIATCYCGCHVRDLSFPEKVVGVKLRPCSIVPRSPVVLYEAQIRLLECSTRKLQCNITLGTSPGRRMVSGNVLP